MHVSENTYCGLSIRPGVARRYCIAELLVLRHTLPYVLCPRDAFHYNAFLYHVLHIPGLANEGTGDPALDREILKAAFRKEHALLINLEKNGYYYIKSFVPPTDFWIHKLCVEMREATFEGGMNRTQTAFGPTPFALLQRDGLLGKLNKDPLDSTAYHETGESYKSAKENSSQPEHRLPRKGHEKSKSVDLYERSLASRNTVSLSVSSNESDSSNSLLNKWGGKYGYNVLPEVLLGENDRPAPSSSLLRASSSGQDQMAWIQYMMYQPLAPLLTPTHATGSNETDPFEDVGTVLKKALPK